MNNRTDGDRGSEGGISQETAKEMYEALNELLCAVCPPMSKKKSKIIMDVSGLESYFQKPVMDAMQAINKARIELGINSTKEA